MWLDVSRPSHPELQVEMRLSWLWQRQGKREAPRQLLVAVYGWFIEGFDMIALQEAQVLLEALAEGQP